MPVSHSLSSMTAVDADNQFSGLIHMPLLQRILAHGEMVLRQVLELLEQFEMHSQDSASTFLAPQTQLLEAINLKLLSIKEYVDLAFPFSVKLKAAATLIFEPLLSESDAVDEPYITNNVYLSIVSSINDIERLATTLQGESSKLQQHLQRLRIVKVADGFPISQSRPIPY